ncbi:hypothetical protein [Sphingobacterium tabacisoli]|jgi:hypothetical protein|uniref:Uncharacterized protein n=1 Tax=Sphingobacterium tabacisoli TaxID=2044855 RepID=A0ABW5L4U3_9SPHI|nr:hypothetical protein [Sphingobacterium tabacisoli]
MIKKKKDKKSTLQRNPLAFYMTNWGFIERPVKQEPENPEKR